ncbi:MAG: hypothetical protein LBU91_08395 [Bacteroidales bacterium]|jgi:hypothetical protein|nr:hypothetical protein [Bacteroidales bacterium]
MQQTYKPNALLSSDVSKCHETDILSGFRLSEGSESNKMPFFRLSEVSESNKMPLPELSEVSETNKMALSGLSESSESNKTALPTLSEGSETSVQGDSSTSLRFARNDDDYFHSLIFPCLRFPSCRASARSARRRDIRKLLITNI